MYILKGSRRNELRWLLLAGLSMVVFVDVLNNYNVIISRNSYILLDIYLISGIAFMFFALHKSDEQSLLASPRFLGGSSTLFTLFFYLVYGSIALYPLVEKRFPSEFIGHFSFVAIFLLMVFPDVLLFMRTKLVSGQAIYQKANLFGFWILLLLVVISVGAGMMASQ